MAKSKRFHELDVVRAIRAAEKAGQRVTLIRVKQGEIEVSLDIEKRPETAAAPEAA